MLHTEEVHMNTITRKTLKNSDTPKCAVITLKVEQSGLRLIVPLVSFGTPWPNI